MSRRSLSACSCIGAAGHIGFIGRAGVFLFVAILFFRLISDASVNDPDATTIGNGLAQLQKSRGGRACLFILGFVLIVYGTFAVCSFRSHLHGLDTAAVTAEMCVGLTELYQPTA